MIRIIVTWRDRDELQQSITSLYESARALNGAVTIVNYGGDARRLQGLLPKEHDVDLIHVNGEEYFNKSRAANVGASTCQEPLLFFCDCDVILGSGVITNLAAQMDRHPQSFATLAGVRETVVNSRAAKNVACFGYEMRIRLQNGREVRIVDNEEDASDGTRQAPGLLLVRRHHFELIRGYNGHLHGWGWEDQDMICRLTLALGLQRLTGGNALHVSHGDECRVQNYPIADRWESRDRMFRQALRNYDEEKFMGTLNEDASKVWTRVCR